MAGINFGYETTDPRFLGLESVVNQRTGKLPAGPLLNTGKFYSNSGGTTPAQQKTVNQSQPNTTSSGGTQQVPNQINDFNTLLKFYPGYAGWDPTSAMADFRLHGGAGKEGPLTSNQSPADSIITSAADSFQKILDDYKTKGGEFDAANPFVFDDILDSKRKEVSDRLDPFYAQTLSDFLRGVNVQRSRSLEDERQVLSEINADIDTFVGREKEIVKDAIETSGEGFADSGLFFSGKRLRGEGRIGSEAEKVRTDFLTKQERTSGNIQTGTKRALEDLAFNKSTGERDIERARKAEIEKSAIGETNIAQARRDLERSQYVGSPFSSAGLSQFGTDISKLI